MELQRWIIVFFLLIQNLTLAHAASGRSSVKDTETQYPSKAQITDIFSSLEGTKANYTAFFSHVSPCVNWTIEGTHPLAGTYTNRKALIVSFARIAAAASSEAPFQLKLVNIVGGGNEAWSVQELEVSGICKSGLVFENRYAWATRWNENSTIVEARAYLDSTLVSEAIQQNEIITRFTFSDPRSEIVAFVDPAEPVIRQGSGLGLAAKGQY